MTRDRSHSRRAACLFLASAVLTLGIIQWSFLPLLIQNCPPAGKSVLELSAGHTSKFAAPFKYLFGGGLKPALAQSRMTLQGIASRAANPPEAPILAHNACCYLSQRPLRAPPSV